MARSGRCGGGFVEIDGNFEAFPDFAADVFGERDAILDGDAFDRNEGNYVGGAKAGMRAGMSGEVDEFGGFTHSAQGGLGNDFGFAGESDDTTIVVGVAFAIEQVHARNFAHG